ncbi:Hypothetical_protein [Hexamita inflata]|uniref:Hypothetical_protein n=1 Tax=Hexamita inflata TaxID=28002 RepID=A0AA86RPV3_9EUKA|nr:Hypothetical protein HINF_LOCUS66116 [Hexamita inflata]
MKWKWKIISKITVVLEQHQYIIQCWARLTHLIPFFKKQKCIHYLNIENESGCNYLNYNSNQAKYQYFILSSRLRLKEKVLRVFVIKKYLKSFRLTQLKMNTEVLCRSSACATSYKLHIASVYQSLDPLILFSNQAQLPYIFEIKSFINQFC